MITGFIIHNIAIIQVKIIIFEIFLQIDKLLVVIDLRYSNERIYLLRTLYINLIKDRSRNIWRKSIINVFFTSYIFQMHKINLKFLLYTSILDIH